MNYVTLTNTSPPHLLNKERDKLKAPQLEKENKILGELYSRSKCQIPSPGNGNQIKTH